MFLQKFERTGLCTRVRKNLNLKKNEVEIDFKNFQVEVEIGLEI